MAKPETTVAFLAFCVSVYSLYYSVEQGKVMQQHNKLSVQPHLTLRWDEDYKNNLYRLRVINTGIGPARIVSFNLKVDGEPISIDYQGGWHQAIELLDAARQTSVISYDWFERGDGVGVGEEIIIYEFKLDEEKVRQPLDVIEGFFSPLVRGGVDPRDNIEDGLRRGMLSITKEQLKRLSVSIVYESYYGDIQPSADFYYSGLMEGID